MNFLTAEVQIVVDYSKLNTQLAKVKQEVMKSAIVMEKSFHRQNKAIEVVNKSLTATVRYTKTLWGQTIKVEKVLGRWSTIAWNFYRKMARNLVITKKLWSVTKSIATTLAKPFAWFGAKMLAGFRETKHFGKVIKEIEKSTKKISETFKVWSFLDVMLHPKKAWKAMKEGMIEGTGAVDVMNDSLGKTTEELEKIKKAAEAASIASAFEMTMQPAIFQPKAFKGGKTVYDISGVMVEAYGKIFSAAKRAFDGILSITTSVFHKIFDMSIWVKTGVVASFAGMYLYVTKAAMDVEDALSMEELGPTRTILQQLGEAFTDIAAAIGKPFLTNIRAVASALTDWLEKSKPQIKAWAETFADRLRTLQLGFIDWVKFLQKDFKGGVSVALRVVSELFKGFAEALIILMDAAGRRAGKALVNAFQGVVTGIMPSLLERLDKSLKWLGQKLMKSSEGAARQMQRLTGIPTGQEDVRDLRLGGRAPTEAESTSAAILRVYRERAENIKRILKDMPTWGSTEVAAAENAEKQIKKSARMMEATGDTMAQHRAKMIEEGGKLVEMQLRMDVEKINRIMEEDFFARFQRGVAQMKVDIVTWGDIGQTVAETMKSSFADAFYAMTTEGRKWKDAMKSFARDVLVAIQKSLAAQTASMIMTGAIGPAMSWLGGLFSAGAPSTQATGINPTASSVEGLQHGGEVLKTGLAVVHKGETYSGEGGGAGKITVNITKIGADFETEVDEFEQMDEHIVNIVVRDIVGGGKLAQLTGAS